MTITTVPGGSNTQVQFNDNGAFGGDAGFTYDKTTNSVTINSGILTINSDVVNNANALVLTESGINIDPGLSGSRTGILVSYTTSPSVNTTNGFTIFNAAVTHGASTNIGALYGFLADSILSGSGTATDMYSANFGTLITGTGTATTAIGALVVAFVGTSGTAGSLIGMKLSANGGGTATTIRELWLTGGFTGSATTKHSIYQEDTAYLNYLGGATTFGSGTFHGDAILATFGTGNDATIGYDGTNLILNPKVVGTGILYVGDGSTGANIKAGRLGLADSAVNAARVINMDETSSTVVRGLSSVITHTGTTSGLRAMSFDVVHNGSSTTGAKSPIAGLFQSTLGTDTTGGVTVTGVNGIARHTVALANTSVANDYNFQNKFEITSVGSNTTTQKINARSVWAALPGTFAGAAGTINRWAILCSGDLQVNSDMKLILEGDDTTKGDSYFVFNAATTDIDLFVDNTKAMTWDNDAIDSFLDVRFPDNIGVQLGTGVDAEIIYDGTDVILDPKLVGTGIFKVKGVAGVLAGASTAYGKVGGKIFDHFADAGNVGTGDDDLYSDTIAASALNTNGDTISAVYHGQFVGSATSTQRLRVYFAGTNIYDSGALAIGAATNNWTVRVEIIRESSSVVRCSVSISTDFATVFSYSTYTRITGLTLSNTQILKVTGEAAGVGAANDQIVAKLGMVYWKSAA